ncbi:MAG TPA: hypothetical protein VH575_07725 [Gemmataceae bacterium]|jgi:hypothetical protein
MNPLYFVGLDLGQAQQYTAIAALERTTTPDLQTPDREVRHYAVRHLQRFPLGTPYTAVCARLVEMFASAPLSGTTLLVDQTAVGRPVVQMLRRSRINARIRAIALSLGQKATGRGVRLVPRKELVSTLQVLLQARRLKVSPALPEAQTLVTELMKFKAKPTTATDDTLESWREGPHDDLVLAVAMAAWEGENHQGFLYWLRLRDDLLRDEL